MFLSPVSRKVSARRTPPQATTMTFRSSLPEALENSWANARARELAHWSTSRIAAAFRRLRREASIAHHSFLENRRSARGAETRPQRDCIPQQAPKQYLPRAHPHPREILL